LSATKDILAYYFLYVNYFFWFFPKI